MDRRYANLDEDPEAIHEVSYKPQAPASTPPSSPAASSLDTRHLTPDTPLVKGWPFAKDEAKRRQAALGPVRRTVDLGEGVTLELVRVPGGEFVMGSADGPADERPMRRVKIASFWMGRCEVTNAQFARFDPDHDSRLESGDFLHFSIRERGYPMNAPAQPAVRVSWHRAMAFCRWLGELAGERITLPTEAQWEWACRAGSATPLWYGALDADFAKLANLADRSLRHVDTFGWGLPSGAVPPWRPAVEAVNDRHRVTAPVGSYQPSPWGLCDLHGNAAEWTASPYRSGREGEVGQVPGSRFRVPGAEARTGSSVTHHASRITDRVVRGGSFYDRPARARSAFRQHYPPWQRVYDVGFRVIAVPRPTLSRR